MANNIIDIPDCVLEELKCSTCQAYLSCGPIQITADGTNICGRCKTDAPQPQQKSMLELILSKAMFPCRFKMLGCQERLLFNNIKDHESSCLYQTYICPFVGNCSEKVTSLNVLKHIKENHANLFFNDSQFEVNLLDEKEQSFVIEEEETVMVIQYCYNIDEKLLYLNVATFPNEQQQTIMYKVTIFTNETSGYIVTVPGEFAGVSYKSNTVILHECIEISLEKYLHLFHDTFSITVKLKLNITKPFNFGNTTKYNEINNDELEKVRCSKCFLYGVNENEYIIISARSSAKGKYSENSANCCKNCSNMQSPSKLIKLANTLDIVCRWQNCSFIDKVNKITTHESTCEYKPIDCTFLNCKEEFFVIKNAKNHYLNHGLKYFNIPGTITIHCDSINEAGYFSIIDGEIIKIQYHNKTKVVEILSSKNVSISAYYQHSHCKIKSKKLILVGDDITIELPPTKGEFPSCFTDYKNVSVVLQFFKVPPLSEMFNSIFV